MWSTNYGATINGMSKRKQKDESTPKDVQRIIDRLNKEREEAEKAEKAKKRALRAFRYKNWENFSRYFFGAHINRSELGFSFIVCCFLTHLYMKAYPSVIDGFNNDIYYTFFTTLILYSCVQFLVIDQHEDEQRFFAIKQVTVYLFFGISFHYTLS